MSLKNPFKRTLRWLVATSLTTTLLNCSQQSVVQPEAQQATNPITRKTSQLTFLKAKTFSLAKVFEVSQLISASDGGTLDVGNDTTGSSSIIFNPGDLSADLNVSFWWDSQGFEAEFGPHGSQFNHPVVIRLSYKDADLTDVVEDSLKIWYYNESNELWELTGQVVNKDEKYVEGTTTHFSRFAIGGE